MKKKIAMIAMVLIVVAAIASGTIAYYTAEDQAHNVITTGGVEIALIEKTIDDSGAKVDFPEEGITGIMPGSSVSKIVSVDNVGGAEAWIRIQVETAITAADGSELSADVMSFAVDPEKWTFAEGWYYHNTPVAPGASTELLFDEVLFASDMGNEYQNCRAVLVVAAEAVQTANNGETALEAAGWPES